MYVGGVRVRFFPFFFSRIFFGPATAHQNRYILAMEDGWSGNKC